MFLYIFFQSLGATAVFENVPVVERSEVVIVSVKPDVVVPALKDVKDLPASKNKLFISVAMGVSTGTIEKVRSLIEKNARHYKHCDNS